MYYTSLGVFLGCFFAWILFRILHCIHNAKLTPDLSGESKIDGNAGATHTRDGGAVESHEPMPDLSGKPNTGGDVGAAQTQSTESVESHDTTQAEIVTAKDTKVSSTGDRPSRQHRVSHLALMLRETGRRPLKFKTDTEHSIVPQNLAESIKKSSGLVIVGLMEDQKDLAAFKHKELPKDEMKKMKISFDDLKNFLLSFEKKMAKAWTALPDDIKTIKLYRQLVGYSDDVSDLLSIFKSKMSPKCHRRSLDGLICGIHEQYRKRANPADDPDYVERFTTKVYNAFKSYTESKMEVQ